MTTSNFKKVIEFNKSFGVTTHNTPQHNITNDNPNLTKLRLDLILEETEELKYAIDTHNFTEIIDALSDILYVVYGAGASFGIDLDKAFNLVHESNMSKLCSTEQEAKDTVKWYLDNKDTTGYDSPDYRKSNDNTKWVVFNKNTGKILKSINYNPVEFSSIL